MPETNLYAALRAAFPFNLDDIAVEAVEGERADHHSWRDIDRASAMIANLFGFLELAPGSRVLAQVDKSVEAMLLYLAVLRAGLVFVPLNTAYQAEEMAHFINDAQADVVVCTRSNFPWVSKLAFQAGTRHVFTLDDDRSGTLLDRAAPHPDVHTVVPRSADDPACIIYTSGTTGRSKGAMLSHGNLLSNARTLKSYWGWQPGDVLIHALPIFHVHGLFVALHGALLNGSKMIWLPRFDAQQVLARLPEATVFMGVPTMYVRLLAEPGLTHEACRRMRLFVSGSAPLLIDSFDAFRERSGHTIVERYGMSETVMITSNPYCPEDGPRRGGTVGRPLPGIEVRVVDEHGGPCPTDAIGGVEVKGPNVFSGYWRLPEKTAEEFTADGWFKTGDVGRLDADGYLTIVGRSKDLIISGGYNVYPAEIEGFINESPGVAESAVVGVPHPDFGEGVIAVVVPKASAALDAAAILTALKGRIANFKQPKQVFIAAELPRNAMGKVQKNLLREEHKALFRP